LKKNNSNHALAVLFTGKMSVRLVDFVGIKVCQIDDDDHIPRPEVAALSECKLIANKAFFLAAVNHRDDSSGQHTNMAVFSMKFFIWQSGSCNLEAECFHCSSAKLFEISRSDSL